MLAILVELLGDRYVATAYNDRDCVEWPPHPARLFSALVATWADRDPDSDSGRSEREALEWLEDLPAPEILASSDAEARTNSQVFVPVNDATVLSEPDRRKLDAALGALSEAPDSKTRAKLEEDVRKLQLKLEKDTEKAIAAPAKIGKSEVAAALRLFPDRRLRKPRTFPSVTPEVPTFAFVWREAKLPDALRPALERLVRGIVRIGHSSTLVGARLADAAAVDALARCTQHLVPDQDRGDMTIRWIRAQQLERLEEAFARHRETEPRVLPARFVRYRADCFELSTSPCLSVFSDDFVVLARVGGPRLPVTSVAGLSRQIRRALMTSADQPVAEILSGHQEDGSPSEKPHLAIVPLPVVNTPHADGSVLGAALILPRECSEHDRRSVMRAIRKLEERSCDQDDADEAPTIRLDLGASGPLELQRVVWRAPSRTLRDRRWCRPSRRWATATPIALDRNPGDLHDSNPDRRRRAVAEADAIVLDALRRIVPDSRAEVIELDVVRSCVLSGTAKPRAYPRFPIRSDRPQRVLVHARIVFAEPVRGPLLVGAGRYQGLGLCLPMDSEQR